MMRSHSSISQLCFQNIVFSRDNWRAEFNTSVEEGSWTSLVGPSGAGKTTLLELIAGFEKPLRGELLFRGENLLQLPTRHRRIAYVFQQNALFPALRADENLLLALHDTEFSAVEKRRRVHRIAERVGMSNRLSHRPAELSGGELARMNLARALLRPALLLLLDEPFAALDAPLRREMNGLVRELHAENNLTTLCVTHHAEDAFLFADGVLVFSEGKIVAQGSPASLMESPPNVESARILDAGVLVPFQGATHYVLPHQFTCSLKKSREFVEPVPLTFRQWKLAETPQGARLVCLETGRSFSLDFPSECAGTLFFDAKRSVVFSQ
jgi:ABC-type sugar transport system ATPase subunit